jgi:hypothetical protein
MNIHMWPYSLLHYNRMNDAKRKLIDIQDNGLDRVIWHIYDSEPGKFPKQDNDLFDLILMRNREYKSTSESPQDYISRLIEKGKKKDDNGILHVVKGDISLDFRVRDEGTTVTVHDLTLFEANFVESYLATPFPLEVVKGKVNVINHHFRLDYQGWNSTNNRKITGWNVTRNPDELVYHC